ncbi:MULTISPECIES: TonB-dependent siderophore receptor [Methylosinus]|uniref:TonB-dependent siderophore receptor n=1 Tax=Methylosinus trichosporium (strain ATCC 35070 / NCIMB 11131 / UNIQEM 75 / OB3b) TaxID=595536 RepID=A0A2D2D3K4_METT3|nr:MULTISPECIES: TonB-dependent receptor [Methylosinus]ATQ69581.1 TonB-dependent siderophore receptor [Methylosinus trichosporium OB3b]OBS54338.1 TonB-dependent receptor [Methylosinus sp. 3S-1]
MGSTLAAAAMSAFALGAGASDNPAQANVAPQERLGLLRRYELGPAPLADNLNAFADANRLQIVYDAEVTGGLRSRGLVGEYSVREALDRLLEGSGLSYRLSEQRSTISIRLAQNDTVRNDASGAEPLPPIDVGTEQKTGAARGGRRAKDTGPGGRFTGYNTTSTTGALKMDAPILQTPLAVQVVTRQTIDDQQAFSVPNAIMTNSSGVQPQLGYFEQYKVRGFTTWPYRNGLYQYSPGFVDTTNVQSIEVLKGPAAMLYGRSEPGGIVNIVTKRPLETPYYSIQEQVGSYGLTRTTMDITGPVTEDKSLLYRFNGEYISEGSFRDFVNDRQVFLAPTVSWQPIEQFKINIDFEYQHRTYLNDSSFFPALGGAPAPIPVSRYLQQPGVIGNPAENYDRKLLAYDWKWDFLPDWSLTNRFTYWTANYRNMNSLAGAFNAATGDWTTSVFSYPGYEQETLATNVDLKGKFETGPLRHSVLLGYDHTQWRWPMLEYMISTSQTMNIYNPTYIPLQNIYGNVRGWNPQRQKWDGLYGQDMISAFDDRVHLLLGGRFDWARTGSNTNYSSPDLARATFKDHYDHGFSPRIGLTVQPLPWLSLYGNFTKSIGANNGQSLGGQALPPQRGEQFEGGVKAEFFDGRLSASAAYFDITKTNVPQANPANPNTSLLVGKVRSQGFEFDLTGQVDENWSLIANYTHDDVRVVQGVTNPNLATEILTQQAITGNVLPGSPRNYGNLWLKYDASGELSGLSLGGGVTAVASQLGDNANSFVLPAYALLRAMVSYQFKIDGYTITAQVNGNNLTNTRYFTTSSNRYNLTPGTPTIIMGSLRVEF